MTTLPKIYKRTSSGKVQEWYMEIDGNKFRTVSGQTDGKKVTSAWTTCAGKNLGKKNATTPEEQALAEAFAKRTKKLDAEYKEKIDDIDNIIFESPMLAEEYKEYPNITYPIFAQPKLDGMRCKANKAGLWSRKGKPVVSCPHIIEILKPVFEKHPDLELDGELYNHTLKDDFDELISIIKQQKPTAEDLAKSKEMVKYYLYDICDKESIFSERSNRLQGLIAYAGTKSKEQYLQFVDTEYINNKKELDAFYDSWLEEGYEGQMIRMDTPYEVRRTQALLKRKEFITKEFKIVEVLEGKGNRAGMAGKVVIELEKPTTDGRTTCEANPKGGNKFYIKLLKEKEYAKGKWATIEFQGYTPKGSLRFPRMLTIRDYE